MAPAEIHRLPDGRRLCFDDVGAPGGAPVVYLHGTPDCRLARHPDDGLAERAGVRLVALDRPGAGGSDPVLPSGGTIGQDLLALLDHLEVERCVVLGWSSGGLAALQAAPALGGRVAGVLTVGALVPVDGYADDAVLASTGPGRRGFMALAADLLGEGVAPAEIAAEVAPHLVPEPLEARLALEVVLDGAGSRGREELAAVPGAAEQLAAALRGAVEHGTAGLASLIAEQLAPAPALSEVGVPVSLWHGDHDEVAPPSAGEWLRSRLPDAALRVVPGAAHHLLFPRWSELLQAAASMYRSDETHW